MGLREALISLNDIKATGIIQDYAIGGGHAVRLYGIDRPTYDLDVFVVLVPEKDVHELAVLSKIYEYYRNKGAKIAHEHIIIEEVPVQFLANISDLHNRAIEKAIVVEVEGVSSKFVDLEYFIVVLLTAARQRDIIRAKGLLEKANLALVSDIIKEFDDDKYTLHERYRRFLGTT